MRRVFTIDLPVLRSGEKYAVAPGGKARPCIRVMPYIWRPIYHISNIEGSSVDHRGMRRYNAVFRGRSFASA